MKLYKKLLIILLVLVLGVGTALACTCPGPKGCGDETTNCCACGHDPDINSSGCTTCDDPERPCTQSWDDGDGLAGCMDKC